MFFAKLLLLTISYLLSLLIFQRGILLKRQILRQTSFCTDVHANPACWIQPRYNRSIWLVIDALRYDFVASSMHNSKINFMPLTNRLLLERPEHTRLFHFIADAPTTTLQRLKALTTGTLPTFIEASENFDATEILEDNIIAQLVNRGKNVTFIGDDTWLYLLPKKFHRYYHAPSFDIKDLHTVDNLVLDKIYDEISRDDWSVLIAHSLGVDHCGHRYGAEHFEMTSKLLQMDELIYNLTSSLADDTILFVMGDHGMTKNGGDSHLEVDAAFFVYSKTLPDYSGIDFKFSNTINQIDFVPTLSLLLDVPIPFSNLGKVIPTLFSPSMLSEAMKINTAQIIRFIQTYINKEPSFKESLEWLIRAFESENADDYFRYEKVVDNILSVLRGAWIKFDTGMIRIGLFSFFECLLFNISQLAHNFRLSSPLSSLTFGECIFRSGLLLLQASLLIGSTSDALLISLLDLTLTVSILYHLIQLGLHAMAVRLQISLVCPFIVVCVQGLSYASNSFIIYESDIIRFFFQTGLLFILFNSFKSLKKKPTRVANLFFNFNFIVIIGCMAAVRIGKLFEKCREEQIECEETILSQHLSSIPYNLIHMAFLLQIIGSHGFFSLGHQPSITMIPWNAAFVGVPGNFFLKAIPGILISMHLFAGNFISVYSLFVGDNIQNPSSSNDENSQKQSRQTVTLVIFALSAIKVCGICIACVLHRRHLMIFKVFAPKFIFESLDHIFILFLLLILHFLYTIKK